MNLLMLTKFYPYGTGEAFIENEIKVFSGYFEKIVIIACEVPGGENRIRTLPDNVMAYKVAAEDKKIDALKGNLKFTFSKEQEIVEERRYCEGIKRRCFLYYFEEKSRRVFETILNSGYIDNVTKKPFMLYSYWLFMTARVGTLIADKYRPELMFTRTHRYDLYENRNELNYLPFRRYLLNSFDFIFPCSDDGTEYLRKKYPMYANKISTAFLGTIDHGIGKSSEDGIFRIVSCSRIAPEKRVDKIVGALKLLDCKGLKVEWHHIGGGNGLDKIKNECEDLNTIKCIFYGDVSNTEVLAKYSENPFDLFVNVSSSEGLPVSIMEAISFGMPVVATDVGGTSEIVFKDVTGQLLPENFSNHMLSEEIAEFIRMKRTEYQDYRNRCRLKWENSFQALPNYKKLCEFLTR